MLCRNKICITKTFETFGFENELVNFLSSSNLVFFVAKISTVSFPLFEIAKWSIYNCTLTLKDGEKRFEEIIAKLTITLGNIMTIKDLFPFQTKGLMSIGK